MRERMGTLSPELRDLGLHFTALQGTSVKGSNAQAILLCRQGTTLRLQLLAGESTNRDRDNPRGIRQEGSFFFPRTLFPCA
jgi:hypothetical protein